MTAEFMSWRIIDFIWSRKTSRILDAVIRITSWMSGLDERLNMIERRLGNIEMALTLAGIPVQKLEPGTEERKI